MNLESIRKEWERKQTTILVVTKKTGDYSAVFIVLKNTDEQYRLHRYFPTGEQWNVSVDKQSVSLEDCLAQLTKAFKEVYPKV
jgi:uncharacterized protein YbdZ (MbtH family)